MSELPDPLPSAETLLERIGVDPQAMIGGDAPPLPTAGKRYTVVSEIGRGGLGRVLKVYDHNLKRHVAMKVLLGLPGDDPQLLTRFIEEAQVTAQLEHPSIVGTYDVGLDKDGNLYFTMRLVYGQTLREILERLRAGDEETERRFTPGHRLRLFQQICQAVGYAHSKGVVHRDLKPENVMLGKFGEVLVLDWGIAKVLPRDRPPTGTEIRTGKGDGAPHQTVAGTVVGTPMYMSPEQASSREIDARSDVYSLGALLYELTTLQPPVEGETVRELLKNVETARLRVIPESLPREVSAIIRRATAPQCSDRYRDAGTLAEDIEAHLEGRRGQAWHDNPLTLAWKWIRRHRAVTAVSILAIASLLAFWIRATTRPGQLTLETVPPGAEVWIDGRALGRTPLSGAFLRPGRHELLLRLDRHEASTQSLVIEAGSTQHQRVILYPRYETIRIETEPAGAEVELLPTSHRGIAPFTLELSSGAYTLVLRKEGFVEQRRPLQVVGGGKLVPIFATLESNWGRVSIDSHQPGVEVWEGDRKLAVLPSTQLLTLPPGIHRLCFERENHLAEKREVTVAEGQSVRIGVYLQPRLLWHARLPQDYYASLFPVDANRDGVPDWILTTRRGAAVAVDGVRATRLWEAPGGTGDASRSLGLLVDGDGDGLADLLHAAGNGRFVLRAVHDGKILLSWESAGDEPTAPTSLRSPEGGAVFFPMREGACVAYPSGSVRWRWRNETGSEVESTVARDVDGDGWEDVLLRAGAIVLAISGRTGTQLWKYSASAWTSDLISSRHGLALGAGKELLVLSPTDGRVVRKLGFSDSVRQIQETADGRLFVRTGSVLFWIDGEGRVLKTWANPLHLQTRIVLADVDGDGAEDLLFATRDLEMRALSSQGNLLWSYRLPAAATAAPVVADVDGDGIPEVVVATQIGPIVLRMRPSSETVFRVEDLNRGATPFLAEGKEPLLILPGYSETRWFDASGRTLGELGYLLDAAAIADARFVEGGVVLATTRAQLFRFGRSDSNWTDGGDFLALNRSGDPVAAGTHRVVRFGGHWTSGWKDACAMGGRFGFLSRDDAVGVFDPVSGRVDWSATLSFVGGRLLPTIDVDRDGVPDLVVSAQWERHCEIYSGGTGTILRRIPITGAPIAGDLDLDGDGWPEVLSKSESEMRLTAADGRVLHRWACDGEWRPIVALLRDSRLVFAFRRGDRDWIRIVSGKDGSVLRERPALFGDEADALLSLHAFPQALALRFQRKVVLLAH